MSLAAGRGSQADNALATNPHPTPTAHLLPDKVTHTVNKGDTAVLSARVHKEKQTDVIWKNNGKRGIWLDGGPSISMATSDLITLIHTSNLPANL